MSLMLRIESGPRTGTVLPMKAGEAICVGRGARADFAIAEDSFLSGRHFEVRSNGGTCTLLDLNSSNGTTVRGARIRQMELGPGDRFTAGQTEFSIASTPAPAAAVTAPAAAPAVPAEPLDATCRERLLKEMRTHLQPLYAVLDAAHDSRILAILSKYQCQYMPLFHAEQAPELLRFAPYVVALPPTSAALEPLVDFGWGRNWGIYLTATAGGGELIQFLRRLLISTQPDGQQVLLRFYDPRVLRTLLSHAAPQQWSQFFGPVGSYLMAAEETKIAVGFALNGHELERHDIHLAGDKPAQKKAVIVPATQRPGPDGRLQLSEQQMTESKVQERDAFAEELYTALRAEYPERLLLLGEAGMRRWIQYGCARSKKYGIQSRPDVRHYVALMMQCGRDFDEDPKLPWAADLLKRRMPAGKKLERLKEAAGIHGRAES